MAEPIQRDFFTISHFPSPTHYSIHYLVFFLHSLWFILFLTASPKWKSRLFFSWGIWTQINIEGDAEALANDWNLKSIVAPPWGNNKNTRHENYSHLRCGRISSHARSVGIRKSKQPFRMIRQRDLLPPLTAPRKIFLGSYLRDLIFKRSFFFFFYFFTQLIVRWFFFEIIQTNELWIYIYMYSYNYLWSWTHVMAFRARATNLIRQTTFGISSSPTYVWIP